jgi:hypothetical protein
MRRIIERVVTVVTTTTWKISWEADSAHAQPGTDPVSTEITSAEMVPGTKQIPAVSNTKEVHPSERKQSPEKPAE